MIFEIVMMSHHHHRRRSFVILYAESDSEDSEAILRAVEGSDLSFGSDQHPENREILLGVHPVRAPVRPLAGIWHP